MKIIFLLPDICTPQEKNFEIFWTKIIFLGSNGRMDVACAISDFKIIIKFGNGPQENNLHHQMGIIITLQLQQLLLPQLQQQYQLHHITLHCTNYTAAHYNYNYSVADTSPKIKTK